MLQEKLGIDDKDSTIMSLIMSHPDISQSEIAQMVKMSQPSVNARVHKLMEKGILARSIGIDFTKANVYLARVDFTAAHAESILNELKHCSFFVNGFIMSGKHNASIMVVGYSLRKIETIIDKNLRTRQDIKDIVMSVVVSASKPFVCEIDLDKEQQEECQDASSCDDCKMLGKHGKNVIPINK